MPLTVATTDSAFTRGYAAGETIRLPIAHHDGNYFADPATLARLEAEDRVAFRYAANPNGSSADIAGVLSAEPPRARPDAASRARRRSAARRHRRRAASSPGSSRRSLTGALQGA